MLEYWTQMGTATMVVASCDTSFNGNMLEKLAHSTNLLGDKIESQAYPYGVHTDSKTSTVVMREALHNLVGNSHKISYKFYKRELWHCDPQLPWEWWMVNEFL